MNVLVCFKIVPDLDRLSIDDWMIDNCARVETRFVNKIINPYDESALELALKLSEQARGVGVAVTLQALTIAGGWANLALKKLRALGYQEAVRIESEEELSFDPEKVATLIATYIHNTNSIDLVMMGRQNSVGDNAKTPLLTAELLKWPCINQVTAVEIDTAGIYQVTSIADEGVITRKVKPPCLLAVGNAPFSYLRVPTLKAIKEQAAQPVKTLDTAELRLFSPFLPLISGVELLDLKIVNRKRAGTIIEGKNAAEKAGILYHSYLKGWLADL